MEIVAASYALIVVRITGDDEETAMLAENVRRIGVVSKSSIVVLDTICDTILQERLNPPKFLPSPVRRRCPEKANRATGDEGQKQHTALRDPIVELLTASICVYRENAMLEKTALLLKAALDVKDCDRQVRDVLSAANAMCRKVMNEFDAAGCMAGIDNVEFVVQELMLGNHTFDPFLRDTGDKIVELFIDSGDIAGAAGSTSRSRTFYLAARFLSTRALSTRPNRSVLMKLADRLGEGRFRDADREIALVIADGKCRRKEFEEALSLYVEYEGRSAARVSESLESVRQEFLQEDARVTDRLFYCRALRVLSLFYYYRGASFHDGVRSIQAHIETVVTDFLIGGGECELAKDALIVVQGHGRVACDILDAIARAARGQFAKETRGHAFSEVVENSMLLYSVCVELEKSEDKIKRLSKPVFEEEVRSERLQL